MGDTRRTTRSKSPVPPPARRSFDAGRYTKGFEELFAVELKVDIDVQRTVDTGWLDKLEASWDPKKVGIIMISRRRNGDCFIVNGQHRVAVALRKDPMAIMDCEVFEGLTVEEEADLFLDYNTHQKPINMYDKYRIALKAGRPVEIIMAATATMRGLEFSKNKGNRQIAAVAACRRIITKWDSTEASLANGETLTDLLGDTLTYAETAFGAHPWVWDGNLLQAIAQVIHHNRGKLGDGGGYHRLVEKLRAKHPDEWQALGMLGVKGGGGSVSRSTAMSRIIVVEYNKRLSQARKLH